MNMHNEQLTAFLNDLLALVDKTKGLDFNTRKVTQRLAAIMKSSVLYGQADVSSLLASIDTARRLNKKKLTVWMRLMYGAAKGISLILRENVTEEEKENVLAEMNELTDSHKDVEEKEQTSGYLLECQTEVLICVVQEGITSSNVLRSLTELEEKLAATEDDLPTEVDSLVHQLTQALIYAVKDRRSRTNAPVIKKEEPEEPAPEPIELVSEHTDPVPRPSEPGPEPTNSLPSPTEQSARPSWERKALKRSKVEVIEVIDLEEDEPRIKRGRIDEERVKTEPEETQTAMDTSVKQEERDAHEYSPSSESGAVIEGPVIGKVEKEEPTDPAELLEQARHRRKACLREDPENEKAVIQYPQLVVDVNMLISDLCLLALNKSAEEAKTRMREVFKKVNSLQKYINEDANSMMIEGDDPALRSVFVVFNYLYNTTKRSRLGMISKVYLRMQIAGRSQKNVFTELRSKGRDVPMIIACSKTGFLYVTLFGNLVPVNGGMEDAMLALIAIYFVFDFDFVEVSELKEFFSRAMGLELPEKPDRNMVTAMKRAQL